MNVHMASGPLISIIIPTRNPHPTRLRRTLDGLLAQTLSSTLWELIIVDSAGEPPLAERDLGSLPPNTRLLRAPSPGATLARMTGFSASQAPVIVFVDDDNVLNPDYLELSLRFLESHPEVGALGGRIVAEFEITPPDWVLDHAAQLALRDFGDQPIFSGPEYKQEYPWFAPLGAGLVMPASAVRRYHDWQRTAVHPMGDRCGSRLGACGDTELVIRGCLHADLVAAYHPALILTHLIPVTRTRLRYLSRLIATGALDWAKLCVQLGYQHRISKWSVAPRILRAFFRRRGWTRSGWLSTCQAAGHFIGRAASRETAQG